MTLIPGRECDLTAFLRDGNHTLVETLLIDPKVVQMILKSASRLAQ